MQDASYEPVPETLPADAKTKDDLVLLTVHLSSSGEVVIHRSSSGKSVDTGNQPTLRKPKSLPAKGKSMFFAK